MRRPGRGGAGGASAHPEEAIGPDRQDQGPQPPVDGGRPRPALASGPPAQAVSVRRGERPARPGLAPMGAEAPRVGPASRPRPVPHRAGVMDDQEFATSVLYRVAYGIAAER